MHGYRSFVKYLAAFAALSCSNENALSATTWTVTKRPFLEARSDEPESDASLRAFCRNGSAIELRVGAAEQVGNGQGEAVAVTFESNSRRITLTGISVKSDDFQMTAELSF